MTTQRTQQRVRVQTARLIKKTMHPKPLQQSSASVICDRGLGYGEVLLSAAHMSVCEPLRLAGRMRVIRPEQRPSALRRRGRRSGPPPQPRGCRLRRPPPSRSQAFLTCLRILCGGGGGRKAGPVRYPRPLFPPCFRRPAGQP